MSAKYIEQLYNCYKRNLYKIRNIEKTIFEEAYDYQKWEKSLRKKSVVLRSIYEQNESLLNHKLGLVIGNKGLNDESVTKLLRSHHSVLYYQ